jgi:hypothetical protein
MVLVSSGGIGFAFSQFLCDEAMLLGILRGDLARLQFRFVAPGSSASRCMGRRWRLKSLALAHLTFRGLAAPHRFRDQLVRQDQPGVGDIFHHQQDVGVLACGAVIAM